MCFDIGDILCRKIKGRNYHVTWSAECRQASGVQYSQYKIIRTDLNIQKDGLGCLGGGKSK
jgi:hypothetical protein